MALSGIIKYKYGMTVCDEMYMHEFLVKCGFPASFYTQVTLMYAVNIRNKNITLCILKLGTSIQNGFLFVVEMNCLILAAAVPYIVFLLQYSHEITWL